MRIDPVNISKRRNKQFQEFKRKLAILIVFLVNLFFVLKIVFF